ncbi:hypothetical protein FQA39_LY15656 [Lamprigera yunnana]|nr:hypothetical protein FQA39_LY15656 [Lamprigera yunnana]
MELSDWSKESIDTSVYYNASTLKALLNRRKPTNKTPEEENAAKGHDTPQNEAVKEVNKADKKRRGLTLPWSNYLAFMGFTNTTEKDPKKSTNISPRISVSETKSHGIKLAESSHIPKPLKSKDHRTKSKTKKIKTIAVNNLKKLSSSSVNNLSDSENSNTKKGDDLNDKTCTEVEVNQSNPSDKKRKGEGGSTHTKKNRDSRIKMTGSKQVHRKRKTLKDRNGGSGINLKHVSRSRSEKSIKQDGPLVSPISSVSNNKGPENYVATPRNMDPRMSVQNGSITNDTVIVRQSILSSIEPVQKERIKILSHQSDSKTSLKTEQEKLSKKSVLTNSAIARKHSLTTTDNTRPKNVWKAQNLGKGRIIYTKGAENIEETLGLNKRRKHLSIFNLDTSGETDKLHPNMTNVSSNRFSTEQLQSVISLDNIKDTPVENATDESAISKSSIVKSKPTKQNSRHNKRQLSTGKIECENPKLKKHLQLDQLSDNNKSDFMNGDESKNLVQFEENPLICADKTPTTTTTISELLKQIDAIKDHPIKPEINLNSYVTTVEMLKNLLVSQIKENQGILNGMTVQPSNNIDKLSDITATKDNYITQLVQEQKLANQDLKTVDVNTEVDTIRDQTQTCRLEFKDDLSCHEEMSQCTCDLTLNEPSILQNLKVSSAVTKVNHHSQLKKKEIQVKHDINTQDGIKKNIKTKLNVMPQLVSFEKCRTKGSSCFIFCQITKPHQNLDFKSLSLTKLLNPQDSPKSVGRSNALSCSTVDDTTSYETVSDSEMSEDSLNDKPKRVGKKTRSKLRKKGGGSDSSHERTEKNQTHDIKERVKKSKNIFTCEKQTYCCKVFTKLKSEEEQKMLGFGEHLRKSNIRLNKYCSLSNLNIGNVDEKLKLTDSKSNTNEDRLHRENLEQLFNVNSKTTQKQEVYQFDDNEICNKKVSESKMLAQKISESRQETGKKEYVLNKSCDEDKCNFLIKEVESLHVILESNSAKLSIPIKTFEDKGSMVDLDKELANAEKKLHDASNQTHTNNYMTAITQTDLIKDENWSQSKIFDFGSTLENSQENDCIKDNTNLGLTNTSINQDEQNKANLEIESKSNAFSFPSITIYNKNYVKLIDDRMESYLNNPSSDGKLTEIGKLFTLSKDQVEILDNYTPSTSKSTVFSVGHPNLDSFINLCNKKDLVQSTSNCLETFFNLASNIDVNEKLYLDAQVDCTDDILLESFMDNYGVTQKSLNRRIQSTPTSVLPTINQNRRFFSENKICSLNFGSTLPSSTLTGLRDVRVKPDESSSSLLNLPPSEVGTLSSLCSLEKDRSTVTVFEKKFRLNVDRPKFHLISKVYCTIDNCISVDKTIIKPQRKSSCSDIPNEMFKNRSFGTTLMKSNKMTGESAFSIPQTNPSRFRTLITSWHSKKEKKKSKWMQFKLSLRKKETSTAVPNLNIKDSTIKLVDSRCSACNSETDRLVLHHSNYLNPFKSQIGENDVELIQSKIANTIQTLETSSYYIIFSRNPEASQMESTVEVFHPTNKMQDSNDSETFTIFAPNCIRFGLFNRTRSAETLTKPYCGLSKSKSECFQTGSSFDQSSMDNTTNSNRKNKLQECYHYCKCGQILKIELIKSSKS